MVQESGDHHLGCIKPDKYWDKLPTSTGAEFLPSTVGDEILASYISHIDIISQVMKFQDPVMNPSEFHAFCELRVLGSRCK